MNFFSGFKKPDMPDTGDRKKPIKPRIIKCPYCFKEFAHDEVHFKAMTLKEGSQWGGADDDFGAEDDDDFDPFSDLDDLEGGEDEGPGDGSVDELFQEKPDLQFKNFWSIYSNELEWEYANYPVITKEDRRMLDGGYHCDSDGFVDSARDCYGVETRERICPYCHNPLPANYGKYKVHFIATVGITSSGKTVYLSQLLKRMDMYMTNVNLVTLDMTPANEQFLEEHPVEKDKPLPLGTPPGTLSAPLFYVVLGNEYHTLVFYDVAGEDCVKANEMHKYGPFIKNADGIIMILDPKQFAVVNTSGDKVAKPNAVLQAMFNAFIGGSRGKSTVPLALALSKSDVLERQHLFHINIKDNSNIFRDIEYDPKNPGFDIKQYRNLMGEVRNFLKEIPEGRATTNVLDRCFSRAGLFAFSSLNCDVKEEEMVIAGEVKKVSIPMAHPNPRRIEEPLLWLLSEFGIIQKLDAGSTFRR